jgi:uncharacterized phage protein (TIGR01671 family)
MSTPILFRAWHTVHKVMYAHKDISVLLKNVEDDEVWKYMQWTGQRDMHKIPIFEGDIIECEYLAGLPSTRELSSLTWRGVVEYFPTHTHYTVMTTDGHAYSVGYSGSAVKRWEVIGNIWANPDLI